MASVDFLDVAIHQAHLALKEWSHPHEGSKRIRPSDYVWLSTLVAGKPNKYAAQMGMLKIDRWSRLVTVRERAQYISRALGHHKQPPVVPSMAKLCPRGGTGTITNLNAVQKVASQLMTPEGPIRRLILQIPPGAGKTCLYLDVLSRFLGNGHTVVVVGDEDIFAVFEDDLRKCPARVYQRMLLPDKKTMAPQKTIYLRDINAPSNDSKEGKLAMSGFCTVKTVTKDAGLKPKFNCEPSALTWKDTFVYFFSFVQAGNWMTHWLAPKKDQKSMYRHVNPFDNKLLLIVDEAHKLGIPSLEQTTGTHKATAAKFPKFIAALGKEPSKNPFILAGTATVNTTQMPTLSLCLPRVIKGFTDPGLFVDDDISKPPRLNLHKYLSKDEGFVTEREDISMVSVPMPRHEKEYEKLSVETVKNRLEAFRGFGLDSAGNDGKETEDMSHPCPVTKESLRASMGIIYDPVDNEENRNAILNIWAGVAFVVDMSKDFRYYPTTNSPYPEIRVVPMPEDVEYRKLLTKHVGDCDSRWTEVSQFANSIKLKEEVRRCLHGGAVDEKLIERMAPKWHAVADDLLEGQLRGRTMIYPGAFMRKGCDDNYYLILLAFYLQSKLRDTVTKTCPGGIKQHQLITIDTILEGHTPTRTQAPAIYIVGDATEGKYKKNEVKEFLKVIKGERPSAEQVVARISTADFRKAQYKAFNDEVCPGPDHVPQIAAGNTIILLAEGGHKALDLSCTSNGLILTTMPGGKFQQTQGRVKRSCAFKKIPNDTGLWHVNVRTYLLWEKGCLTEGPVIDQTLHAFYNAQYEIIQYLEMLEAQAGIGCSNWEAYSKWQETFSPIENLTYIDKKLGKFKCVHDAELSTLTRLNEKERTFYSCAEIQPSNGDRKIRRTLSGDVDVNSVTQSTRGTCMPDTNITDQLTPHDAVGRGQALLRAQHFAEDPNKQTKHASNHIHEKNVETKDKAFDVYNISKKHHTNSALSQRHTNGTIRTLGTSTAAPSTHPLSHRDNSATSSKHPSSHRDNSATSSKHPSSHRDNSATSSKHPLSHRDNRTVVPPGTFQQRNNKDYAHLNTTGEGFNDDAIHEIINRRVSKDNRIIDKWRAKD